MMTLFAAIQAKIASIYRRIIDSEIEIARLEQRITQLENGSQNQQMCVLEYEIHQQYVSLYQPVTIYSNFNQVLDCVVFDTSNNNRIQPQNIRYSGSSITMDFGNAQGYVEVIVVGR